MKKTLLSLSFVATVAAFTACGTSTEKQTTNDDATVEQTEATETPAKCGEGKADEVKKGKFEMMDSNSDGNITETEFVAFVSGKFSAKDADGNGSLSKEECHHFDALNTDGDDIITEDEFNNGLTTIFAEIDTDGDGNITKIEMKAHMDAEANQSKDAEQKCGEGKCGEGKCGAGK